MHSYTRNFTLSSKCRSYVPDVCIYISYKYYFFFFYFFYFFFFYFLNLIYVFLMFYLFIYLFIFIIIIIIIIVVVVVVVVVVVIIINLLYCFYQLTNTALYCNYVFTYCAFLLMCSSHKNNTPHKIALHQMKSNDDHNSISLYKKVTQAAFQTTGPLYLHAVWYLPFTNSPIKHTVTYHFSDLQEVYSGNRQIHKTFQMQSLHPPQISSSGKYH